MEQALWYSLRVKMLFSFARSWSCTSSRGSKLIGSFGCNHKLCLINKYNNYWLVQINRGVGLDISESDKSKNPEQLPLVQEVKLVRSKPKPRSESESETVARFNCDAGRNLYSAVEAGCSRVDRRPRYIRASPALARSIGRLFWRHQEYAPPTLSAPGRWLAVSPGQTKILFYRNATTHLVINIY